MALRRRVLVSLVMCLTVIIWVLVAVLGGLQGWWLSPIVAKNDANAFSDWARVKTEQESQGNSAFVLIEEGKVISRFASPGVDGETLFPAASMSKFITGIAVMSLVKEGKLELDQPAATYLTRWQLPDSSFDNDQVTIRGLLSHTSGLTDGLGFGDYQGDETIPSLQESLINPRASSEREVKIEMGQAPGEFLYSGGGYLVLELIVEEVSGMTFEDYVTQTIFEPMGIHRSTYAYLADQTNRSDSFFKDGSIAPIYKYASKAATGLSTSTSDLEQLVMHLDRDIALTMRSPHAAVFGLKVYGLGSLLYAPTDSGDFVFGHDGGNDPAINSSVRINPETSDAFIMLETGHPSLASDIGAEWVLWQTGHPDFRSISRALRSAITPALIGSLIIIAFGIAAFMRKQK